ncbi:hypothetical protein BDA96_07G028400 [Sorghum bicolor]|uniref:Uncharacterized protein n=2 Tax=Sorghum bicolor TaxID=4558 RepID=A0A921U8H5_SORBI|nr:hypothetical protein BDA96_07G028400 [Sorghum bicolor]KXG24331.1 hypothetical protein SORBI_3007G026900 [Sorghum bicolor]
MCPFSVRPHFGRSFPRGGSPRGWFPRAATRTGLEARDTGLSAAKEQGFDGETCPTSSRRAAFPADSTHLDDSSVAAPPHSPRLSAVAPPPSP